MTLVEVLAGTALLGTLLAGLLVSSSRLTALSRRSYEKEEACRAADDLLDGWWPKKEKIPRNQSGDVPNHPGWSWRTSVTRQIQVGTAKLDVLAVDVRPSGGTADANDSGSVRVEVLLPAIPDGNHD